jgi:hypothetical protein
MTDTEGATSGSDPRTTTTVRTAMIATTQQVSTGSHGVRMDPSVGRRGVTLKSPRPATAYQRALQEIALELGMKPDTVKDQLNNGHSAYAKVATFNRILLAHGLTEEVATRMALIDSSLMGERVPSSKDADHAEDVADAEEDVAEAEFRRRPCPETWEKYRPHVCRSMYRLQDVIASHDEEYR